MLTPWWKESVVYQIYPRSFADSNGDGIGDLRGIIQKLDYLQDLGVDVVWLSPIYQSPNDDNGYDISDYQAIMPEFGSMADFDELLAGLHQRGMKLVMDLVVNHTSDEHAWFLQSRQSTDNPFRDYYFWRPPRDGREPNNWASRFGGSAWQLDPMTGEYYLHLFSKKQPDLNWDNPRVRASVYQMMHWWLEKGIDGFRMDVINMISKEPGLPDAPAPASTGGAPVRYQLGDQYYLHGPRLLEFLGEMKREVLDHYDLMTVGETPRVDTQQAIELTDEQNGYLSMVFQFQIAGLGAPSMDAAGQPAVATWGLADLKQIVTRWQVDLAQRGWNSNYLSNHDQPRQVSHFGDDGQYRVASAKLLGTLNHLLRGTPYVYQGEEIGMTNVAFDTIDDYRDIATLNLWHEFVDEKGFDRGLALAVAHAYSRDNARTPMQWSAEPQAGFTLGTPWLKVNPNYPAINVARAQAEGDSIFHYYQRLIRLRRAHQAIVLGDYQLLLADHPQIFAFSRALGEERLLVVLNFSREAAICELPAGWLHDKARLLIANYDVDPAEDIQKFTLRPWEARVYQLR